MVLEYEKKSLRVFLRRRRLRFVAFPGMEYIQGFSGDFLYKENPWYILKFRTFFYRVFFLLRREINETEINETDVLFSHKGTRKKVRGRTGKATCAVAS